MQDRRKEGIEKSDISRSTSSFSKGGSKGKLITGSESPGKLVEGSEVSNRYRNSTQSQVQENARAPRHSKVQNAYEQAEGSCQNNHTMINVRNLSTPLGH